MFVPQCHWMKEMGWHMWLALHYIFYSIHSYMYRFVYRNGIRRMLGSFSRIKPFDVFAAIRYHQCAAICQRLISFNHIYNWTKHKYNIRKNNTNSNSIHFKCCCVYSGLGSRKKKETYPRLLLIEIGFRLSQFRSWALKVVKRCNVSFELNHFKCSRHDFQSENFELISKTMIYHVAFFVLP